MSLGMRERLGLQKSVKQNLAALRGGEVGMRERLSLQKQIKADLAKLGGEADAKPEPQLEQVTRDNTDVGETVEWRNEIGTVEGNFRGVTDDGQYAVIVSGGMQMTAPISEVFKQKGSGSSSAEPPAHERIKAALDAGDASEAMQIAQAISGKAKLEEELVRAGISVIKGNVSKLLAHAWPQMQKMAGDSDAEAGDSDAPAENQTAAARYHMENLNLYVATHGNLPFPGSPNTEEGEAGMQMMQLIEAVKKPGVEAWLRENYNPDNLLDRALAYKGGGRATVDNLQAVPVEASELPADAVPEPGQVVLNAQRPLMGHKTSEGPSINGRHYAVIDLNGDDAQNMVEQNRKLGAMVLAPATKKAIEEAAISRMPYRYRSRLDSLEEKARNRQVQMYVDDLRQGPLNYSDLVERLGNDEAATAGSEAETGERDGSNLSDAEYKKLLSDAGYLTDVVWSLTGLDGVTKRQSLELSREVASKSKRDDILMDAFSITRELAHSVNNTLDSRTPNQMRVGDMQEAFSLFPLLKTRVDAILGKNGPHTGEAASGADDLEAKWAALSVSERERIIGEAGFAGQFWAEQHARGSKLSDMQASVRESVLSILREQAASEDAGQDDTNLTSQAARGDFNGLGLPEFIDKLKEAYSADEDLEGAKEAAVGYLEANRDELEAA